MRYVTLIAFLLASSQANCQLEPGALLNEVKARLSDHVSVSTILSDSKYLSLHSETSFRELIKAHCDNKPLTIVTKTEPGKKIRVIGTVKNASNNPVTDIVVYLYQTDARGWYAADAPHIQQNEGDMRHARLFGYVRTDDKGQFELHTVKPSGYPKSDLPAHIHIHVSADGYDAMVTELLFDDDDRLKGSIRDNAESAGFLISKPEKATAPFEQQFSYTLILEKD